MRRNRNDGQHKENDCNNVHRPRPAAFRCEGRSCVGIVTIRVIDTRLGETGQLHWPVGLVESVHNNIMLLLNLFYQPAAERLRDLLNTTGVAAALIFVGEPHALAGIDQHDGSGVFDELLFGTLFDLQEENQNADECGDAKQPQCPASRTFQLDSVAAIQ